MPSTLIPPVLTLTQPQYDDWNQETNTDPRYWPIRRPGQDFSVFPPPASSQRSPAGAHTAFSRGPLCSGTAPQPCLGSMTLVLPESSGHIYGRRSLRRVCLLFPREQVEVMGLCREATEGVPGAPHLRSTWDQLDPLMDAGLDLLAKVLSASFSCKITAPFPINMDLWGTPWAFANILFLIKLCVFLVCVCCILSW